MSMFGGRPKLSGLAAFGAAPWREEIHRRLAPAPVPANEAHWRSKAKGSISAPKRTLGEILEQGLVDAARKAGVSDRTATRVGKKVFSAVNDLTPVGNVTGAQGGAQTFRRGVTLGDLGTMGIGAGMFGLSVLPSGAGKPVKKKLADLLTDESGAIRAWHGSPHDFDKFSVDKIGTGEGAQAYGHGLYFAENRAVADEYRSTLSAGVLKRADGSLLDPSQLGRSTEALAASFLRNAGDPVAARAALVKDYGDASRPVKALDNLIAAGVRPAGAGRLYEVNINAEPEEFLNWDAPTAPFGAELYSGFSDRLGQYRGDLAGRRVAAEELRKRGIPGIRYLDQGSRGVGGGTRNYVVFDDKLIDILNKY